MCIHVCVCVCVSHRLCGRAVQQSLSLDDWGSDEEEEVTDTTTAPQPSVGIPVDSTKVRTAYTRAQSCILAECMSCACMNMSALLCLTFDQSLDLFLYRQILHTVAACTRLPVPGYRYGA